MATKVVEMKDIGSKMQESEMSPFSILFELEGVATEGRRAAFEVLKNVLGEQGVEITPIHFSRYCLSAAPAGYLADLLEAVDVDKKFNAARLAGDVMNGIAMQLAAKDTTLNEGFAKFIDEAKSRKMRIGAFTSLPESTAQSLLSKLGLADSVQLFAYDQTDKVFPRADTLMKVAKELETTPRYCIVIAGNKSSCKAGLSAGMRSIAVPDQFTAFQDFSGSEVIVDDLSEINPAEILDELCPEIEVQVPNTPPPATMVVVEEAPAEDVAVVEDQAEPAAAEPAADATESVEKTEQV